MLAGSLLLSPAFAFSQGQSAIANLRGVTQANRIAAHANMQPQTRLSGHIPPWVTTEHLSGDPVDALTTMHLTIVLRRDPAAEAAFEQLLADQQDRTSPLYHQWLTPQKIGELFGPTEADIDAVSDWLTAQGLKVDLIAPSRTMLQVSGSVAQVSSAFRTSFGYFTVASRQQLAAMSEPFIPTALTSVVQAIGGLADLPPEPASHGGAVQGPQGAESKASEPKPLYTTSSGVHYLAPNDFTTIYDIGSVYSSGNTGTAIGSKAQHIAVIDRSDVAATDISEWAANVGLTGYKLNTILATGTDPGQTANGDQLESTLDVNRTLSTAPGATTDLVLAPSSTGGIFAAASYNVNTLVDPVMSISFYGCEANYSASATLMWDTLFKTGAAEGISTFVCAGDAGAAGCAKDFSAPPASTPVRSANYICSSSYATCVGGTEFIDTANSSLYWSSSNSAGRASALSYIPEGAWNEAMIGTSFLVQSGGGGVSQYISKPSWQTGLGVPADGFRDQPDVAFASAAHDGYYSCLAYSGGDCSKNMFEYLDGTSAAAPAMAAIAALLNTRAGVSQGNINPMLYQLAATAPSAFHDVTVATSGVADCTVAVASVCNNSTPGPASLAGGLAGYAVTAGYDQATGLGSLDVARFLAAASPVSTTLGLAASATMIFTGQPLTLTATVNPAGSSVAPPSGSVAFYSSNVATGSPVALGSGGTAPLPLTSLAAGVYTFTAKYSGDTYFTPSASASVSVTVSTPSTFTLSVANPSLSFSSGAVTGNSNMVTLSSVNAFVGAVAMTCNLTVSTAAYQPACSANPASLALTSGGALTAVVTISSSTPSSGGNGQPGIARNLRGVWRRGVVIDSSLGAGAMLALIFWNGAARRRKLNAIALSLVFLACSASLGGCTSSSTETPVPPVIKSSAGTYTATVTASSPATPTGPAFSTTTSFAVAVN